jgi:hypothetical protein
MKPLLLALISKPRPYTGSDQRSSPRGEESGRFAGLGIRGGYHIVTLHNVSAGGACVQLPVEARAGERVKITSGTLNRLGRIAWVEGQRSGIEFD